MMKFLKLTVTALSAMLVSSCSTFYIIDNAKQTRYRKKVALTEEIVFVGKPKTPIVSHPYAMVLVGKNHSILVSPTISASVPQTLFNQIFEMVDLTHLYINTQKTQSQNSLELYLGKDPEGTPQVSQTVGFLFVKPTNKLKTDEQKSLQDLGFACKTVMQDSKSMLACKQEVAATFTLAKQVKNAHGIPYRFKEPLMVNFTYDESYTRPSYLLLTPLALTMDVVTLPIIIPTIGMAALSLSLSQEGWH